VFARESFFADVLVCNKAAAAAELEVPAPISLRSTNRIRKPALAKVCAVTVPITPPPMIARSTFEGSSDVEEFMELSFLDKQLAMSGKPL
jgi:hypothetical protein